MSIIFPDESKMSIEDLIIFKKDLTELLYNESYDINDLEKIKNIIRRLEGYLIMADKKKLFNYLDYFYELGLLNILNGFLNKGISQISFCILECIYILLTNIQNTGLIFYLYSTKYQTYIPGCYLNIIDKIISIDARKKDEFLTYQVNFRKSLTLKLNIDCIEFFFDKNKNQFPILNKAFSLYDNKDAMIRSVVKNIFLKILKINDQHLRQFLTAFPNNIYYPNIIFQLRNIIIKLCLINFFDETKKNPIDNFRDEHDYLLAQMYYISDLLLLGIENVNFILINCILNEIILPLIKTIISQKQEKVSIVFALYILILFIYIVKNQFINDVISYCLFEENISTKLLEKIKEFEFKAINKNLMNNVNSIIINNQYADVNDPEWKTISNYMADVTGVDLSDGKFIKNNIYNFIKHIIYNENIGDNLLIKNEILNNIKMLFTAKDDCILIILNLLIYTEISFYSINNNKDETNNNAKTKNLNDDKEVKDNISKTNLDNININNNNHEKTNIISNNINDELIEKIKNDLFDDEEDENNNNQDTINNQNQENYNSEYNVLKNNFFKLIIPDDDDDDNNLYNLLLKLIESPKNFRLITNEIILANLSLLLNNNKSEKNIKIVIQKLSEIFNGETQKLKKLLTEDTSLKFIAFENSQKAFQHYTIPIDKKIKDLVSSPFILVPLIYLDTDEDTPIYLRENKYIFQTLQIYILNIFILYDILSNLLGFKNDLIINSKKFPLQIQQNNYVLGNTYSDKDLGKKFDLNEIIINNKIIKSVIFFDMEYFYLGNILSNSYNNLSEIKIIKKLSLRNIVVKIPKNNEDYEENTLLEIYDKTDEGKNNKNHLIINCFKTDKAIGMKNDIEQQRINSLNLEYSLFESFFEAIKRKISVI